MLIDKFMFNYL